MLGFEKNVRTGWGRSAQTLLDDLHYSVRLLWRSPGFTITAILTLALSVAATTAMFSVIDGILLKPLEFAHPRQLVAVQLLAPKLARQYPMVPLDPPTFTKWSRTTKLLSGLALADDKLMDLTGAGEPTQLNVAQVTPNLFNVLGVEPALGHNFSSPDNQRSEGPQAILAASLWRSQFHSDPQIIGRGITLNGRLYTVVGVLPPSFHFPSGYELSPLVGFGAGRIDLFVPLWFTHDLVVNSSGDFSYAAVARLKAGATPAQARAELDVLLSHDPALSELGLTETRAIVMPLRAMIVRSSRSALWLLFGGVLAVLLIVAVNVACLAIARAATRKHETAIRCALGASPGRLFRQSLAEMLLLSVAAGALGFIVASAALRALLALAPAGLPRLSEVHLNLTALWFTLVASFLSGLIAGLVPAWRMRRTLPLDALRAGSARSGQSEARPRAREWLIGTETAVSVVLVVTASLLVTSFARLEMAPNGFSVKHVICASLELSPATYTKSGQVAQFALSAIAAARAIPGVNDVAITDVPVLGGSTQVMPMSISGDKRPVVEKPMADFRQITPDFFRLLGIPLLEGRELTWADENKHLAVISDAAAKAVWPGRDPIGQTFQTTDASLIRVIGVVADTRSVSLVRTPSPMVYELYSGKYKLGGTLLLRSQLPLSTLAPELRQAIWKIDPTVPIPHVNTLGDVVLDALAPWRFETLLTSLFAAAALLLVCLGIYGVVSYITTRRTQEIAVRMALGGSTQHVYCLILSQGLRPIVIGLVIGLCAALGLDRLIAGLLFGIQPDNPLILVVAAGIFLLVSGLACALPARRATHIIPSVALRLE